MTYKLEHLGVLIFPKRSGGLSEGARAVDVPELKASRVSSKEALATISIEN
jgi:hypothetical protein